MSVIRIEELSKCHHGGFRLGPLSFALSAGEILGLMGPNGAGKTTLLRLIWGFSRPDHGKVSVFGLTPHLEQLKVRLRAGYLSESPHFYGWMKARRFLQFMAGFYDRWDEGRVAELGERLDVDLDKRVDELSKGNRVKLGLMAVVAHRPQLLLLDEPTSGLDPVAANDVRALIRNLRAEHAFIISSHNLDEIRNICDEIIIIDKGTLVRHCTIQELTERDNYLTIILEHAPPDQLLQNLKTLPAIVRITADTANPKKLSIQFQGAQPDEVQFRILELLRRHDAAVVEFSKGSAFTDKVVELVRGH